MSAISLRLPNSLHRKLGELARREGVSINQLQHLAVEWYMECTSGLQLRVGPGEAEANLRKHGVSFVEAVTFFEIRCQ
jgi:hypothetical protein